MKLLTLLAVAMAVIVVAATAGAANLAFDQSIEIMDQSIETNFDISIYPGKASYSGKNGAVTGLFGDGTVKDYRLFSCNRDGSSGTNIDTLITYADGDAGLIAPVANTPHTNVDTTQNWADVWTTNDPGSDFSTAANYTSATVANAQNITGTIDVSTLESGTVYFIHGTYKFVQKISLTMSGAGLEDIAVEHNAAQVTNNRMWITSFNFVTDGYDTITYTYTNQDADGSAARFMGVIIDGAAVGEFVMVSPANDEYVDPGATSLVWQNMDPNAASGATATYAEVLFGTDPGNLVSLGAPADVNTVNTDSLDPGIYYWQVISYPHGDPATTTYGGPSDPNAFEGPVFSFTNDAAVESFTLAAPAQITWLGEPVGLSVADLVDDGRSDLSYTWSYTPDDSGDLNLTITLETVEGDDTTATLTVTNLDPTGVMLPVTVTLEIADQTNPGISQSVIIDVYDTACDATRIGLSDINPIDFDGNCMVDLKDLALMATTWLKDTALTEPILK